jgi:ArsR family transcriptional regulator
VIIVDPVELLDILGNENRRRILQLLSFRPFYFNEMAKRLDVGPKAVIDHLEMLERAGLIECYHDQSRRKYFRIAQKTVVEIAVSPHSYGVRAYRSEQVPVAEAGESKDLKLLQKELGQLEEQRRDLRKQLEEIEARDMEIKRHAVMGIQSYAQDQLEAEILVALLSGGSSAPSLAEKLEVPMILVEETLKGLEARGIVKLLGASWSI